MPKSAAPTEKGVGMYPDAHPTAPGGMSRKALIKELEDTHGYEGDWTPVTWPDLIDMVINERLAREAKARVGVVNPFDEPVEESEDYAPMEKPTEDMFDLLDDDEPYEDTEGNFDTSEQIEEALAALEDADLPEWDTQTTPVDPSYGTDDTAHMGEYDDGIIDPEVLFAEMELARDEATPPPVFIGIPGIKDYIFDGHAGAGPSGAERWMNCTMSLSASRAFLETLSPNQQRVFAGANTAARQGTTAHAAAEAEANFILGRVSQEEVDYTIMELSVTPEDEGEAYDDEMGEYITEYTDLVKSYAQERGDDHVLIESRVEAAIPLTDLHEGEVYIVRGSADLVALPAKTGTDNKTLVVGDLKYGNGIEVDVDENPQIRLYALGVLELLADPETGALPDWLEDVVYHIIQPRLGGIKTWTESIDDLLEWRDEVLAPALTRALYGVNEGATYEPTELACQFCPARGGCPALTEQRVASAAGLFDVIVDAEFTDGPGAFPETTTLTDTRLGELLTMAAGLHDIYKDLKEEAQRRLHRGGAVPGYQLVNYTPPRKWSAKAVEVLAEMEGVWKDPTLMTPTQALKVLKDDAAALAVVEPLVEAPDKRPVIAKEGDRRKTWEGKPPEQMFPDLPSETEKEAS